MSKISPAAGAEFGIVVFMAGLVLICALMLGVEWVEEKTGWPIYTCFTHRTWCITDD